MTCTLFGSEVSRVRRGESADVGCASHHTHGSKTSHALYRRSRASLMPPRGFLMPAVAAIGN